MVDNFTGDAAVALGLMMALQTTVRALITIQPNSAGLIEAFQREHDEAMETMFKRGIPRQQLKSPRTFDGDSCRLT